MLKPITTTSYKQYMGECLKKTGFAYLWISYVIIAFTSGRIFFLDYDWRLFLVFMGCLIVVGNVVSLAQFFIALWLEGFTLTDAAYALDDREQHPHAIATLMTGFWRNERVLQVFSVVAGVTGIVWSYRSLAPLVEGR